MFHSWYEMCTMKLLIHIITDCKVSGLGPQLPHKSKSWAWTAEPHRDVVSRLFIKSTWTRSQKSEKKSDSWPFFFTETHGAAFSGPEAISDIEENTTFFIYMILYNIIWCGKFLRIITFLLWNSGEPIEGVFLMTDFHCEWISCCSICWSCYVELLPIYVACCIMAQSTTWHPKLIVLVGHGWYL